MSDGDKSRSCEDELGHHDGGRRRIVCFEMPVVNGCLVTENDGGRMQMIVAVDGEKR